jgi:3-methyladenine DNA glycosylase AlkD
MGAKEPLFGVTISAMKPLSKKITHDNNLAKSLYNSGNYDAMYLAGMIVDPSSLTEEDFEDWINKAYASMIGEFIVSIVLAESPLASNIAMKWVKSGDTIKVSAGYNTFTWVLGYKGDSEINYNEINELLDKVKTDMNNAEDSVLYAINSFLAAVGISYKPLYEKALSISKEIMENKTVNCKTINAAKQIENAISKGHLGFKRKNVRC